MHSLRRRKCDTVVSPVLLWLIATTFSVAVTTASGAPQTPTLPDIHGKPVTPLACAGREKAAVIIFITTDCPIANAYAPEIGRIVKEYAARGIRFTLAHVDPALGEKEAAKHAAEYGYDRIANSSAGGESGSSVTLVNDRKHALVTAAKATTTPEAAVFGPDGDLLYRGRINNLYAALGDKRAKATAHDLRDALDAILAGKKPAPSRTDPVGCSIEPL